MQEESKLNFNAYNVLIKNLEKRDTLPLLREIEYIPSDEELKQRKNQNQGLTRPELAILLAYSKIHLYQDLLHALKNTACFGETYYTNYFPKVFQEKYKNYLSSHPLKLEITATVLANLVINTMGPCFVWQMSEAFRVNPLDVVLSFVEVFELISKEINNHLDADLATTLIELSHRARNISQCVMVRLSQSDRLISTKINYQSKHVPFSIIFNYQLINQSNMDIAIIEENYKKLGLSYLWEWAETIRPVISWQNASWLLLQLDLIKVITNLCQQSWEDERFEKFYVLYNQLKDHVSSLSNSSQDLLLLDYVVRQLRTL
jgi:NAD-specific glutamate dehydrogenase